MVKPAGANAAAQSLSREIGLAGAVGLGLGSILGTGVFVSMALAADSAGPSMLLAILVAGGLAACNGLSSAQLAVNHPLSGGTYEYAYRWLHPSLGFTAGWLFLVAKSASAATAALGIAGYLERLGFNVPYPWSTGIAAGVVLIMTLAVLAGIRRTTGLNTLLVLLTLASLALYIVAVLPVALDSGRTHFSPFLHSARGRSPWAGWGEACALLFVAFTGYGRLATMAEEVREPQRTIPLAILSTLTVSLVVYLLVAATSLAAVGSDTYAASASGAAPLASIAEAVGAPGIAGVVAVGACIALLGVLLNLILGLSRVVLAMGRRGDLPICLARINRHGNPFASIFAVGGTIAGLSAVGNVRLQWSLSAFAVLLYYALTNLAALRLTRHERLYPRGIAVLGLLGCLGLAFWIDPRVVIPGLVGTAVLAGGHAWFQGNRGDQAGGRVDQ